MRIKKFHEFSGAAFEDNKEDFDLLGDLENIGMQEKTYPRSLIKDALDDISFNSYVESSVNSDDFEFKGSEYGNDYQVDATFTGTIAGEWDYDSMSKDIIKAVESRDPKDFDPEYEEDRYTIGDIEGAIDRTNFDDIFSDALDGNWPETDIDMKGSETGNGSYYIETTAEVDSDAVDIDDDKVIDAIMDSL